MSRRPTRPDVSRNAILLLIYLLPWLAAGLPARASAATRTWVNAAGGNASVASNWTPAVAPTAADAAVFNLAGNYSVTWTAPQDTLTSLSVRVSTVGFLISTRLGISGRFSTSDASNVSMPGGLVRANEAVIGVNTGTPPTTFARLLMTNGSRLETRSTTLPLVVGDSGGTRGVLHMAPGASVSSNSSIVLGRQLSAPCSVTVVGSGTPFVPSAVIRTLAADAGSRGDVIVGNRAATTFDLRDGGIGDFAGDLFMSQQPGGGATLRMFKTASNQTDPRLAVRGGGYLGCNLTTAPATNGRFSLEAGTVEFGDTVRLGDPEAVNTFNPTRFQMHDGTMATFSRGLRMYEVGGGSLEMFGGTLRILGGVSEIRMLRTPSVSSQVGSPVFWLSGSGRVTFHPTSPLGPALDVGRAGAGRVRAAGGQNFIRVMGALTIADSAGGTGVVEADSGSVVHAVGPVLCGAGGRIVLRRLGALDTNLGGSVLGTVQMEDGRILGPQGGGGTDLFFDSPARITGHGTLDVTATVRCPVDITPGNELVMRNHVRMPAAAVTGGRLVVDALADLRTTGDMDELHVRGKVTVEELPANAPASAIRRDDPMRAAGAGEVLHVRRELRLEPGGGLEFDVTTRASGGSDAIVVDSLVTLQGALYLEDQLVPPADGDTLTLITAPQITGQFTGYVFTGSGYWLVLVEPTRVIAIRYASPVDAARSLLPNKLTLEAMALGSGRLRLDLPGEAHVRLELFDVLGRRTATLRDERFAAGRHELSVGSGASGSGVLFARATVRSGERTEVRTARVVLRR